MVDGAGFTKDMNAKTRGNRALLKGDPTSRYQSFDTSYITESIISRKPLVFKDARPEYLLKLRSELKRARKIRTIKITVLSLLILGALSFGFFLLLGI